MGKIHWGRMKCAPKYSRIETPLSDCFRHAWDDDKWYYGRPIAQLITVSQHCFLVIATKEGKTFIVRPN